MASIATRKLSASIGRWDHRVTFAESHAGTGAPVRPLFHGTLEAFMAPIAVLIAVEPALLRAGLHLVLAPQTARYGLLHAFLEGLRQRSHLRWPGPLRRTAGLGSTDAGHSPSGPRLGLQAEPGPGDGLWRPCHPDRPAAPECEVSESCRLSSHGVKTLEALAA
jgi:hypothetical protein